MQAIRRVQFQQIWTVLYTYRTAYTLRATKKCHFYFYGNKGKFRPILIILSQSVVLSNELQMSVVLNLTSGLKYVVAVLCNISVFTCATSQQIYMLQKCCKMLQ